MNDKLQAPNLGKTEGDFESKTIQEVNQDIQDDGVTTSDASTKDDRGNSVEEKTPINLSIDSDKKMSESPHNPESQNSENLVAEADSSENAASRSTEQLANDQVLFEEAMASLAVDTVGKDASVKKLTKGDRVEATVIHVEKDRVFVDLGTKSEGVIPLSEVSSDNLDSALGALNVGDKIKVIVLKTESAEGNPIVSKKRADFEDAWKRIVQKHESGEVVTAVVVERVRGGLVVDLGVRGFVPATHVGTGRLRNIDRFVGQSLPFKILEVDNERKKVVLSNKLAEDGHRETVKEELFKNLSIGDIVKGTIRRLTDYGAFVDLGGMDGLLHISEMSWARIEHPKEVLKEGQEIQAMVLKLDPANAKISLGLRQVLPDPWKLIRERYVIGQKFNSKISRLAQTGAFLKLEEGAEAFLPISEISNTRIKRPSDVLEVGQDVEVKILDLRPDERRMVLSLRESDPSQYSSYDGGMRSHQKKRRTTTPNKKGISPRSFEPRIPRKASEGPTIGERLGSLKGLFVSATQEELEEDAYDENFEEIQETDRAEIQLAKEELKKDTKTEDVAESPHKDSTKDVSEESSY